MAHGKVSELCIEAKVSRMRMEKYRKKWNAIVN